MAVTINWIPVEERLPYVDNNEAVTYVTCEDLDTGKRYVDDNVGFNWWGDEYKWVRYEDIYCCDWYPVEDDGFRVIAWSTDTVDILPY